MTLFVLVCCFANIYYQMSGVVLFMYNFPFISLTYKFFIAVADGSIYCSIIILFCDLFLPRLFTTSFLIPLSIYTVIPKFENFF